MNQKIFKVRAFVAIVLIVLPCLVFSQNKENESYRLKVMTYNLRFGERASLEELAKYIRTENPDVVALQEVDVNTRRSNAPHQNGKDFITQLGFHTGRLTAFARTIDYAGGYYGVGILSKYPFQLTKKTELPLPEGSNEQRALLIAEIELPGGNDFTFVSTHLDHSSSSVRAEQVQALNQALSNCILPVIVAGDFNAKPDDPEMSAGMKDYLQLCNDDATFPSENPVQKIDYLFGRPENRLMIKNTKTPGILLSDHLPVISEVELK